MRLPDFIIIGAAKAGTTSIFRILEKHPDIFMCSPKEPEFFARAEHYEKGIEHYSRMFSDAEETQICGEASTLYTLSPFFPDAPKNIHAHIPNAKLIYVIRNPVERSFSYYQQLVKNYQNASGDFTVHRTFEEFLFPDQFPNRSPRALSFGAFSSHLPDHPDLFLAGSDYLKQINAYLEYFDRAHIHFVKFEQFRSDPDTVMSGILKFLDIGPFPHADAVQERANISHEHFDTVQTTLATRQLKNRLGPLYSPAKLLPSGVKRALKSMLRRSFSASADGTHKPKPMHPETRQLLFDRFCADRAELAALTGLDLSDWGNR